MNKEHGVSAQPAYGLIKELPQNLTVLDVKLSVSLSWVNSDKLRSQESREKQEGQNRSMR